MILVCPTCNLLMKMRKIGEPLEAMTSAGSYKLFSADRWKCPSCGHEVMHTTAKPMAEHFEAGYEPLVATYAEGPVQFWSTEKEQAEYWRHVKYEDRLHHGR